MNQSDPFARTIAWRKGFAMKTADTPIASMAEHLF